MGFPDVSGRQSMRTFTTAAPGQALQLPLLGKLAPDKLAHAESAPGAINEQKI